MKGGIPDPDNDPRFMPKSKLVPNEGIKIGPMVRYKGEFEVALESGATDLCFAILDRNPTGSAP